MNTALKLEQTMDTKSRLLLKSVQDSNLTPQARLVLDLFIATMRINETRVWTSDEIQSLTGITASAIISRMTKLLENQGYIIKTISKTDGRKRGIKLMPP